MGYGMYDHVQFVLFPVPLRCCILISSYLSDYAEDFTVLDKNVNEKDEFFGGFES